jgi:hypothetical protein
MSADQGEHEFVGTRPDPYAKAFVQFRADQAGQVPKAAEPGGGQSMIWAMPVRRHQARASACDYDATVAHDGQLDEETVAEPGRLADIGRKLLLAPAANSGTSWRCSSQPVLFELVVAELGALLVSAWVASVFCAEHRRDTPISRG